LSEKYPGFSPYNYALGNSLRFIDLKGDSAWSITNSWTDEMKKRYRDYVSGTAGQTPNSRYTCEDLALSLLIGFASENGLPLSIENESGTMNAASDDFSSVGQYAEAVMTTTGANDLMSNTTGTSSASPGDLLIQVNNNSHGHHAQVVSSVGANGTEIYQGNVPTGPIGLALRGIAALFHHYGGPNPNNPTSSTYIGMSPQHGIIDANGTFKNLTTGRIINDYMKTEGVQMRSWNFNKWRK
jgi:hypothetical protein